MDAARKSDVKPIPTIFSTFQNRNDYKTKKEKKKQLAADQLDSHAQV